ncbi:hypothetical protein D3C87_1397910 [compost metagenome]
MEVLEHLTEDQRKLYLSVEYLLMSLNQTNEGFVNGIIAIEALAKTMRLSHDTWLKRQTYH